MTFEELREKHNKESQKKGQKSYSEANIQAEFFKHVWIFLKEDQRKLIFHVPNEGKRSKYFARSSGITSGVSDIIMLIPNSEFHGLLIEFKTDKGNQSNNQKEFEKQAVNSGYKYVVCRSAYDAIKEVQNYLKN